MRIIHCRKIFYEIFSLLLVFTLTSSLCFANNLTRTGRREIFAQGQIMNGDTTTGLGLEFSIDNFTAYGLGYGFNINEHLNMNFDLYFSKTNYLAADYSWPLFFDGDVSIKGYDLNLDINLLKNALTPLITGGIGYINFSGNSLLNEFNETDFSYNLGVGIRDEVGHFLFKLVYRAIWTKMKDSDSTIMFDGLNLALGYIF